MCGRRCVAADGAILVSGGPAGVPEDAPEDLLLEFVALSAGEVVEVAEAGVGGVAGGAALFGLTVALFCAVVHGEEGAFVVVALDVFAGAEDAGDAVAGALETGLGGLS